MISSFDQLDRRGFLSTCAALAVWPGLSAQTLGGSRPSPRGARNDGKLIAFHLDMRMPHYRTDYLKRWVRDLARAGYNAIVWEATDGVAWQTCPEVVPPSALSRREFRDVLEECRQAGIESIPLLQILGHADYVLKHQAYAPLRDHPDSIYQYAPLNARVLEFLGRWIDEHLELFGPVRHFHVGADEARLPFRSPEAEAFVRERSAGALYAEHVNRVTQRLVDSGITPIIWADMALAHHDALDLLSKRIVMLDWKYDLLRENGKVFIWGKNRGMKTRAELSPEDLRTYGRFLFPEGNAPGTPPETFYTSDFLVSKGFAVMVGSAAKNSGDNVFSPRSELHLKNTFDWVEKGRRPPFKGSLQVGWSHHMHPWELELAFLDLPGYMYAHPSASLDDFRAHFVQARFGTSDDTFWRASELLSGSCLFTATATLGWGMDIEPVPANHVATTLDKLAAAGSLASERERCRARTREYEEALQLFTQLRPKVRSNRPLIDLWLLAARNLINRAAAADLLLSARMAQGEAVAPGRVAAVLLDMRRLRLETDRMYAGMIRLPRREQMVAYLFEAVERAVGDLASGAPQRGVTTAAVSHA